MKLDDDKKVMRIDDILEPILETHRPLALDDSMETVPSWDSARQVDVILAWRRRDLTAAEIARITSIREFVALLRRQGLEVELAG